MSFFPLPYYVHAHIWLQNYLRIIKFVTEKNNKKRKEIEMVVLNENINKPPIDQRLPEQLATATFSMG
ncbi:MAG: hypothetical protein A2Y23_07695 [Clostridiales bacterium GWB2_37_7]|nr:MAG: hypothetical protein A2Y23_07695 [Clostridiales bacterium GWB2_37_7]